MDARRDRAYTAQMIPGLPFKPVDPRIAEHPVERRGFVTVPLDYGHAQSPTIDIFYRLIPAHGGRHDDASKPIVVVINGGPGIPASFYRPLDYDYTNNRMPHGGLDRFAYLLQTHRVLIADQRGTDGGSAPLDFDDPAIDANHVAAFFSSDSHALDYLAVIDHVIPADEPFFVIGQSYGGLPAMQLIAQRARRRPAGVVFSSSALPYEDPLTAMRYRRQEQLRLNLHLREAVPDIEDRLAKTRAHLSALGLDPGLVHGLFALLGKDVSGKWEPALVARLDTILGQTRDQVMADVAAGLEEPSLINYILSSSNFSPGWTDRTLAAAGSREIPFEPWMIDEHVMLQSIAQVGGDDGGSGADASRPSGASWRQAFVDAIDAAPPTGTPFPSIDALRAAIAENQVLFTAADNDAMVPSDGYHESLARFLVPGHTEVRTLPGGHHAIFLEKGYEAFLAWSRAITPA